MKILPMTEIFCDIDDCYREFKDNLPKNLLPSSEAADFPLTVPPCMLSPSEMMTLVVVFHLSHYRTFKHFWFNEVSRAGHKM